MCYSRNFELIKDVDDDKLAIGFTTKQRTNQLPSRGEISEYQYRKFFQAAVHLFMCAAEYPIRWYPLDSAEWM